VFHNIRSHLNNQSWVYERAIVAPQDNSVYAIDLCIQQQLTVETSSYIPFDTVVNVSEVLQYPTEFLNSFKPSGMPTHKLVLQIDSLNMLLMNLDAPRLCVKLWMLFIIEAIISWQAT
jgi:hypothetical protein